MKHLKRKAALLACMLSVCCFSATFAACDSGITSFYYDNEDKYTIATDAAIDQTIESLHVCWIEGSVKVDYHNEDTVLIEEYSIFREPRSDETMRFWLDGTTLRIQYAKSGIKSMKNISKNLTITLPNNWRNTAENQGNAFKSVDFETISADITAANIAVADLSINTVSGNIELDELFVNEDADVETVSGNVEISFENVLLDEFSLETVSGEAKIYANQINDFEADTVSGNIHYTAAINANSLNIEGVSSTIYLNVPTVNDLKLKYETTSGMLLTEFSYLKNDKVYKIENGEKEYEIQTVSGNLKIENI